MTYSRQHKRYLVRSPLRYPGSKAFLFDTVRRVVNRDRFLEGFAGSAILSLNMRREGKAIHINDIDPSLYALWKNIKENPSELAEMVLFTPIDIYTYRKCAAVLKSEKRPTLELAFSVLFLNRTNFSGMLGATVIGGESQDGKYRMDVRFNRSVIVKRIGQAASLLKDAVVTNKDALSLIDEDGFLYLDPPYLAIDGRIYRFNYTKTDMQRLLDALKDRDEPWMLSYTPSDFIDGELVGFHSAEIDRRYGIKTPFEKGSIEKIWSNVPLGPMTTLLETPNE